MARGGSEEGGCWDELTPGGVTFPPRILGGDAPPSYETISKKSPFTPYISKKFWQILNARKKQNVKRQ